MSEYALQDNGYKKLSISRFGEQFTNVISAQILVQIETFVQKQLDKLFPIRSEYSQIEYAIFNFDLFVIVPLKYFRQSQLRTIPVQRKSQIPLQLRLSLFVRQLSLSFEHFSQTIINIITIVKFF